MSYYPKERTNKISISVVPVCSKKFMHSSCNKISLTLEPLWPPRQCIAISIPWCHGRCTRCNRIISSSILRAAAYASVQVYDWEKEHYWWVTSAGVELAFLSHLETAGDDFPGSFLVSNCTDDSSALYINITWAKHWHQILIRLLRPNWNLTEI